MPACPGSRRYFLTGLSLGPPGFRPSASRAHSDMPVDCGARPQIAQAAPWSFGRDPLALSFMFARIWDPRWGSSHNTFKPRGPKVGDGSIQSLAAFVGERGLDQAFERCTGIAAPEQTRDHDHELAELGLPAFMGLAIAFD